MRITRPIRVVVFSSIALLFAVVIADVNQPKSEAIPRFSHEYNIPCKSCHTIPPKLTPLGLAFQANGFNWPGGHHPAHYNGGLKGIPISTLTTFDAFNGQNSGWQKPQFETFELFTADGFDPTLDRRGGGFFIDYLAASNNGDRPSDLGNAFVTVPLAGDRGQLAVTFGQFNPILYQWDSITSLTNAMPVATDVPFDNVSFDVPEPGIQLSYFDNRGKPTANGNYIDLGVVNNGHLTLNKDAEIGTAQGAYLHFFHRYKYTTEGMFFYDDAGRPLAEVIGTENPIPQLYLLGMAGWGDDANGQTERVSAEADYLITPYLAATARVDSIGGSQEDTFPVFALTYYPANQPYLRFSAETIQEPANRSYTLQAIVQF